MTPEEAAALWLWTGAAQETQVFFADERVISAALVGPSGGWRIHAIYAIRDAGRKLVGVAPGPLRVNGYTMEVDGRRLLLVCRDNPRDELHVCSTNLVAVWSEGEPQRLDRECRARMARFTGRVGP